MNIALFEVGLYWMLVAVITGSSSGWGRWVLHLRSLVNILIWGNGDWNEVEKLKYAINLKKKQLSLLACHEVTVCAMKIQLVPWGFCCLDCLINTFRMWQFHQKIWLAWCQRGDFHLFSTCAATAAGWKPSADPVCLLCVAGWQQSTIP